MIDTLIPSKVGSCYTDVKTYNKEYKRNTNLFNVHILFLLLKYYNSIGLDIGLNGNTSLKSAVLPCSVDRESTDDNTNNNANECTIDLI